VPRRICERLCNGTKPQPDRVRISVTLICQAGIAKRPNQINYTTNIR
jgi:hypothetical protein